MKLKTIIAVCFSIHTLFFITIDFVYKYNEFAGGIFYLIHMFFIMVSYFVIYLQTYQLKK